MSYFVGLKRLTNNFGAVSIGTINLRQRNSDDGTLLNSVVVHGQSPISFPQNELVWFPNYTNITDVGGLYVENDGSTGFGENYEIYIRRNEYETPILVPFSSTGAPKGGDGKFPITFMFDVAPLFPSALSNDQKAVVNGLYTPLQQTIIYALAVEQQLLLAYGSTVQKNSVIESLDDPNYSIMLGILPPDFQITINAEYNEAQKIIIDTLSIGDKLILAYGSDSLKTTVIDSLTLEQQAVFSSTPIEFVRTAEQIAADKLTMEQVIFKLTNGEFINDDDSVFFALSNSLMAQAAMVEIDSGRGFNGLRSIGLTKSQALKVLSIYNVKLDTLKYESEVKLELLQSNPALMNDLSVYLAGEGLELPNITMYLSQLRANSAIYAAIRNWIPS